MQNEFTHSRYFVWIMINNILKGKKRKKNQRSLLSSMLLLIELELRGFLMSLGCSSSFKEFIIQSTLLSLFFFSSFCYFKLLTLKSILQLGQLKFFIHHSSKQTVWKTCWHNVFLIVELKSNYCKQTGHIWRVFLSSTDIIEAGM